MQSKIEAKRTEVDRLYAQKHEAMRRHAYRMADALQARIQNEEMALGELELAALRRRKAQEVNR